MRRMINNTTAIAACLSLLVPQFAQAQGAPAEGEQPPVPPAQEQPAEPQPEAAAPAAEAQAEPAEPASEPAAETPEAQAETQPAPEAEPAAEAPAEPAAQEPAPEPAPEPQSAEAAEPAPVPEAQPQDAEVQEAEGQPEADAAAERPEPAAREQQQDRPEDRPADQATQAEPLTAEPPAAAEAAREQDQERPAPAAREQQAERPEAAPAEAAEDSDPLRDALDAEQQAEDQPAAATADEPAQAEAGTDAPAAQTEAEADAPAAPGEDELRDALTREQAGTPATEEQPQSADQSAEAPGTAPEANPPATEGAQQAAQETGAATAATAAALNEDQQGEVVEQQITEENSRSSDEDFATSLRDALAPQAQAQAEAAPEDDDDDDNDLAKALLLGLGAVAVGTYLNNNRQVALSAPDRVVVTRADGSQEVIKDEVALLRQPGSTVATENFDDGSSRTVVTRADGSRVVTIRDADLRVLRRTLVSPDGTQTRLIDDTAEVEPVDVASLPAPAPVAATGASQDEAALRAALQREVDTDRRFTLGQIRSIPQVRALVPPVTIDAITFDTGSAAISPDQARQLSTLGGVIQEAIAENPREMFLIEGHTDTVGADAANLALSDRRAESVALALTEYFQVPPENLVVQGYGEQFPQVAREGDVRENRRAAVRRITDLLQTAQAQ